MSPAIDVDRVTHVLLSDGWHEVSDKSFTVAPYEFGHAVAVGNGEKNFVLLHGAGDGHVCPAGFEFKEARTGASMCGPLTSVVAVRWE